MGEILIGGTASLLICIFLSPSFIGALRAREFGQQIREEGPAGHHAKAGTPTMGGIIIFTAISVPFLILVDYSDWRAVGVYIAAIACAGLGLVDDAQKVFKRRSLGLRGRWKLVITILISLFLWWVATEQAGLSSTLRLRSIDATIDLGIFYPVLIYLVVAGTSNAVNLTDGLDGLARAARRSCCSPTSASRSSRRASRSSRCSAAAWSAPASGFLWFNAFPATIFMGDTGSLGLGGAIAGWRS
jgi:phospho-N-acetylmuramoyl-pentapeptide-transferase